MPKELVVNRYYYSYGHVDDDAQIVIETRKYIGIVKANCSSVTCDVPFHFYAFESISADPEERDIVRIPSLEHVHRTMFTIDELLVSLKENLS